VWTKEFFSNSDYNSYIRNIEKQLRNSVEYKDWLDKIRTEQGAYKCAISGLTLDDCSIEVHHTPVGLFDIVDTIITNQKGKFCTFSIALEIMQLHFDNFIGFMPVTKSIHEQIHNGVIKTPVEKICGNYRSFVKNYKIPTDIKARVKYIVSDIEYGPTD
jgi:hypothetical protein